MKKNYKCEVDCANCAEKIACAIKKIEGVNDVKVNFLTQKFKLDADDARFEEILEEAIKTGRKIEPGFAVER